MFLQLGYELPNRMVEMSGFNQPPKFPAKDFRKRQGTFKEVIQILPIYSYHRRRPKSLVRKAPEVGQQAATIFSLSSLGKM